MKKDTKNNIVNFPSNSVNGEREVEAILFAAAEPRYRYYRIKSKKEC